MVSYIKGGTKAKVFENWILKRIFDPKTDQSGERRRLHNEELHSLYFPPNIVWLIKSKRLRLADHIVRMKESRSAFKMLTSKYAGKRPLGRPKYRWYDNITLELK